MNDETKAKVAEFNCIVDDANQFVSIARDMGLQKEAVGKLASLACLITTWKEEAIAVSDEDSANLFLGMECVVKVLSAEISMYILLKAEQPEKAWDFLVAAQTAARDAIHAHKSFAHIEAQASRLHAIERVLFPPQMFLSAGLIVGQTVCTICGFDYDDCPHVVGMPYWGRFCHRKLLDIKADHVAIVKNPANKRCRITHFSTEDGMRNRMTWRIDAPESGETKEIGDTGLLTRSIIMTAQDLVS